VAAWQWLIGQFYAPLAPRKTGSLTRTVRSSHERTIIRVLVPIRLAKVFREGCVGYPRRYTIRGSNGAQSRVRTDRSCLPHDKSARHSGALQMTSAPAYNWYVSNQYLDTRDTGYRDSRNVCFWLAVATAAATRTVPQLLGSLQRCSSINYYPSSSRSSPRRPPARPTMSPDAAIVDKVAFWANASR